MIPDKPKSFLDTLPKLSEADLELDVMFQTRFGQAPAIVINDGSLVDSTEGERLYHKHRKNVVKCGDLLWLLSPATAQWWWIFWRQVERIGYENIMLVTGRAGTGKTTYLEAKLKELGIAFPMVHLCAPTGVACARLRHAISSLGNDFSRRVHTPHSMFKMSRKQDGKFVFDGFPEWVKTYKPRKDKYGQIYVLDEAANADLRTVTLMMMRVQTGAKFWMIGDIDQLPPVGYGHPMRSLLDCQQIGNRVNLTKVHRTAVGSEGLNAAVGQILDRGQWPEDGPGFSTEVSDDMDSLTTRVTGLMRDGYQVLASTNALALHFGGLHSRERFLEEGSKRMCDTDGAFLRKGDMCRILISDHANGVFNGQLARYEKWLPKTRTHIVTPMDAETGFSVGRTYRVTVPTDMWETSQNLKTIDQLKGDGGFSQETLERIQAGAQLDCSKGMIMHAESITIHRAQGSEWDKVVLVVPWPSRMLNRSLAYVGISRARVDCKVIFMRSKTLGDAAVELAKEQMLRPAPEVPALKAVV